MAPSASQQLRRVNCKVIPRNAASDVNEFFFFFCICSPAHGRAFMWNDSFMPVVHEACQPTRILTLPGFPCSRCADARSSYTHIFNNTNRICAAASQTSTPPPLGFSQPVVYFLPVSVCLCQSALFRLALGGQPFSIPSDVPWKSVSRATRVPNTLPVASSLLVPYLHFLM